MLLRLGGTADTAGDCEKQAVEGFSGKATFLENALVLNVLAVDSCSHCHGIRCRLHQELYREANQFAEAYDR